MADVKNAQTTLARMELFVSIFQEVIVVTAQKDIQGIPAKKVNITSGENEDDIYKNESADWQAD